MAVKIYMFMLGPQSVCCVKINEIFTPQEERLKKTLLYISSSTKRPRKSSNSKETFLLAGKRNQNNIPIVG